ncbi:uncharacterized protein LOC111316931 [Durio zibethinus]|uniref:Uncharacterized protein LOC111316929 isoform X2 n=1 Tax=Durio zibethinus TaxID=66656 RepID=A0A6P6BCU8_DURZI|nr:uncharacterized protein LOC111316929 isoform X2 [Durio zibethinus]XP_022774909.1 uncharacterized protein LOC111316931 [Durio zibethinus]
MHTLKSSSIFSTSYFLNFSLKPKSFIFILSYSSSTSVSNPPLFNYLVKNLDFTETQAVSISNRYSHGKSLQKAHSVANFFQSLGFSNAQIASAVHVAPQILFADVEKKLRPTIKLFQDLGLVEPHLGNNNEDLFKVFNRCNGFIARDGISNLSRNIEYFESCGIVGSQLSKLLMRQPRIFRMRESALRDLVTRVVDMGISTDSRMLVHGIHTLSCLSEQTFKKKCELLKTFGFSDNHCLVLFRKNPAFFRVSEEKMKLGIEFFLNVAKFDRNVLAYKPNLLMSSLEDRVIPRYRVFQIINSKKLLKTDRSFYSILEYTENKFLEFISRFPDDVEELLMAYKAHLLHTSSSEEEENT